MEATKKKGEPVHIVTCSANILFCHVRHHSKNVFHVFRWTSEFQKTLSAANVIVTAVSVILVIGNMSFAAAVIAGIFGCLEK